MTQLSQWCTDRQVSYNCTPDEMIIAEMFGNMFHAFMRYFNSAHTEER